jgi:Ni/Co efflux regulator RcnB
MTKLMMSAVALTVCLGSAALAQDSSKTTTTMSTPEGTTTTTTTKTSDGYRQYTRTETATKHYDAGVYVGPSGYTYSRYVVGQRAPVTLIGEHYRLEHYSTYGLDTPPDGLTWIRVGNDALLVDGNTGEVVRTEYDLFAK